MPKRPYVLFVAILASLTAACAGPGAQVAVTPAATAPAADSPQPTPAAAASPTALPAATKAAPSAVVSPTAAPAAPPTASAATKLTIAPDGSEMRYRAREQLTGRPLPGDAVGSTRAITGSLLLDPSGAIVSEQSKITVDLQTLRSDESRRDNFIQRNTLETSQFPTAELVLREARGLPTPLPASGEASFQLVGDLTVHGVTRPVTWDVTARFEEQEINGTATTEVKMTDFGMTPPRVGPVLSIEDATKLELDFRGTRERIAVGRPAPRETGLGSGETPVLPVVMQLADQTQSRTGS